MSSAFPRSVIVVGAGAFGLSTALAINRRFPSTKITVVDRLTPPVRDGTSVDTSRIIRPDYVDQDYERLAVKSQSLIKHDPDLAPHYFEHGFAFCTDGKPGELDTLWNQMFDKVKNEQPEHMWQDLKTHEQIFEHLHRKHTIPVSEEKLGRQRSWVKGYTSKRCATVNAEAMIKVYYDRCQTKPNIEFAIGTPVQNLLYDKDRSCVEGVILEGGKELRAEKTILATGAWSGRLIRLDHQLEANAVPIAYIRLTVEEYEKYKDIACHTNLSTGFNLFTPIGGLLKILRRSAGIRNMTTLDDPEDPTNTYGVSYPRTKVDDPSQSLSLEVETGLREELREIFPDLADRPFEQTKICWLEQTSNGDFLICPHPRYSGLHLATGGSLHGWKFLPLLGEFVVDSITGQLEGSLAEKWSWESKAKAKLNKYGFMTPGRQRELGEITRHSTVDSRL